jgi:hypothetical protein
MRLERAGEKVRGKQIEQPQRTDQTERGDADGTREHAARRTVLNAAIVTNAHDRKSAIHLPCNCAPTHEKAAARLLYSAIEMTELRGSMRRGEIMLRPLPGREATPGARCAEQFIGG